MNTRELKFRVYNKKTKQWVHGPNYEVNLFGECILLGGFMNKIPLLELNDCVPLQYTGLTDKNGKEIYEGDILNQVCDNKPCYYVVEWGNKSSYCGFVLHPLMKRDGTFRYTTHDFAIYLNECFEIIGNIYDNSELIKSNESTT